MSSPEKVPVPADVYTEDYYRHCRQGSDEFGETGGGRLSPLHEKVLALAAPLTGRRVLDVGCGCGELVIHAAMRGAEAVGVDYSPAAHRLAVEAAERMGVRARFHLGDVSELPEERFDAVILADVIEHLHQGQLEKLYRDLHERLLPGGRLIIHTWPNRWHTEFSYPVARMLLGLAGIRKPKSPRKPHDEVMHVNEQSILSLRRDLRRADYRAKVWVEHVIPEDASTTYRFTHAAPFVKLLFADHLFAVGEI